MFKHVNNNSDIGNLMDKYQKENEAILKNLANIEKELGVLHQHEEEIISKRVFDEEISKLEKIIAEKDERINDLVEKATKLETKIDTLENWLTEKLRNLEEKLVGNEDTLNKDVGDEILNSEAPPEIQNEDFPAKEIEHTAVNEIEHETQEEPPDFGDFNCSKC
jgi:hypothetical protein